MNVNEIQLFTRRLGLLLDREQPSHVTVRAVFPRVPLV